MQEYQLRIATRYTDEEKSGMISDFIRERNRTSVSLDMYANRIGVSKYTFRDWYRDARYNPEWEEIHPKVRRISRSAKDSREAIRDFLKKKKKTGISLREYSGLTGIPYYTLRSWWRKYGRPKTLQEPDT